MVIRSQMWFPVLYPQTEGKHFLKTVYHFKIVFSNIKVVPPSPTMEKYRCTEKNLADGTFGGCK